MGNAKDLDLAELCIEFGVSAIRINTILGFLGSSSSVVDI